MKSALVSTKMVEIINRFDGLSMLQKEAVLDILEERFIKLRNNSITSSA